MFGGGLAAYKGGVKVGAVGVSGDTSCTDHMVAWRTRNTLGLDGFRTPGHGCIGRCHSPRQHHLRHYRQSGRDRRHGPGSLERDWRRRPKRRRLRPPEVPQQPDHVRTFGSPRSALTENPLSRPWEEKRFVPIAAQLGVIRRLWLKWGAIAPIAPCAIAPALPSLFAATRPGRVASTQAALNTAR